MRIPVFVSCPTVLGGVQERARSFILGELDRLQLEPRALGRTDYPTDFPLREVYVIARHCAGGIILGFSKVVATPRRTNAGKGRKRNVGRSGPVHFPTPWNHLEAGILFGMRRPLLILREKSVRGGVFDDGVTDVFLQEIPLKPLKGANLEAFREILLKWSANVRKTYYRLR